MLLSRPQHIYTLHIHIHHTYPHNKHTHRNTYTHNNTSQTSHSTHTHTCTYTCTYTCIIHIHIIYANIQNHHSCLNTPQYHIQWASEISIAFFFLKTCVKYVNKIISNTYLLLELFSLQYIRKYI